MGGKRTLTGSLSSLQHCAMAHRQVDLDQRGRDYVLAHLRGVNRLCDGLARAVEGVGGHVFTVVPDDVTADRVYDFATGGLLSENRDIARAAALGPGRGSLMSVANLETLRAARTLDALVAHPGAVCLCDHVQSRWGEEAVGPGSNAFGVGDETYHLLTAQSGLEVITDTLRSGDALWHGVAAVCLKPIHVPAERTVDPDALTACALSALELTCTAYDGEGFLTWIRNDR